MAVGMLEVLLVYAAELKDRDCWCGVDCLIPWLNESKAPYAKLQYGTQNQTSSLAQGEGKKDVWNEKFRFQVEYNQDKQEEQREEDDMNNKLVLSIMDRHPLFSDFHIGKTTIYIKDVILCGMEEGKLVHGPHKYRVVRPDKSYAGEICVAVTFIKLDTEGDVIARRGGAANILQ